MSNKIMNSGELLSILNKNIDKSHHHKPEQHPAHSNEQQNKANQSINNLQAPITNQSHQTNKIQPEIQLPNQNYKLPKKNNPVPSLPEQNKSTQQEEKEQPQRAGNRTNRSNLQKSFQIKTKQNNFKSQIYQLDYECQQQEIGETLHEILAMQIGKLVTGPLAEVIENAMKEKQSAVYIAFTESEVNYLQNLLDLEKKKPNNSIDVIESLLAKRQGNTLQKIDQGELYIDRLRIISSKNQIQELSKIDVARLLKIKDGTIRSKIDLLNDKMFQIEALENSPRSVSLSDSLKKLHQEKLQEMTDPRNFSLNSQKTKIANDYVRHLQQQKLLLLKKMRQQQQRRFQMQKQRQLQLKQAQEMRRAAKKQEIQQKIKQFKKKKQQQTFQQRQKSKKVEQFLKEYRKSMPLYKKKEKEFDEVIVKKRNKQFQEKLKAIKQTSRSMSLNEIKQHEQKYLQKKQLEQSKKEEEFKMMIKARKAESVKQYFKGFYHDKIKIMDQQEKMKFYSLRESTKIKIDRITEFDEKIRKLHKPKVDPKKKQALERIIELDELKKKKVKKVFKQVQDQNGESRLQAYYEEIPQVDHYKEGNRYMQIAKSLAKKKNEQVSRYSGRYSGQPQTAREKKSLQKSLKQKSAQNLDQQSTPPIISQQKDIWRLRSKQLHQMTDDVNANNFSQIMRNLEVMDDKAKMKEELLKHKSGDAHEMMQQKSMLDQFYFESIKNKIKLLNQ